MLSHTGSHSPSLFPRNVSDGLFALPVGICFLFFFYLIALWRVAFFKKINKIKMYLTFKRNYCIKYALTAVSVSDPLHRSGEEQHRHQNSSVTDMIFF